MKKSQCSELDEQLLLVKQKCDALNTQLHKLNPEVSLNEEEYNRPHPLVSFAL